MTSFNLQIITPEKVFFDAQVQEVLLRSSEGELGIMARHESFAAILPPGKVRIKVDGELKTAAISYGTVKVSKEKTVIIATSIEWADEINVERAEIAKAAANEMLESELSSFDREQTEFSLKRAMNRIAVSGEK
ncbi:MAG: ATP synthase F1 subunit epsilon [Oscillospiraceae bacterium]|jgi:F-type H+-transporting ATPase subunit epsilon|nr:ATP synthase F1 subunit epsilon [Oscillospiraceae bacterium]